MTPRTQSTTNDRQRLKQRTSFYDRAAKILDDVQAGKGSIYSLAAVHPDTRHLCALIFETLKYRSILEEVIERSGFRRVEKKVSSTLALLMIHDLLLSKHGLLLSYRGPALAAVLRHKTRLHAELVRIRLKKGVNLLDPVNANKIRPRWARINTLKSNRITVLAQFPQLSLASIDMLSPYTYAIDTDIPDLIAFHPSISFTQHPAYLDGSLILQDKASCLPAFILSPPPNSHVIDACAAPGNKTTHLAALMNGIGRIWAFERDQQRFNVLNTMIHQAGAEHLVNAIHADFIQINVHDPVYQYVTHILLDPSCSGSGRHLTYLTALTDDTTMVASSTPVLQRRLRRLASFQLRLLTHAMAFPSAQRITYSTCSVHVVENESVVIRALNSTIAQMRGWRVIDALPHWPIRGNICADDKVVARACIRCDSDQMTGFFVCCFVREVPSCK